MTENRKPFLSFASDIDDDAIEAMARSKGVPALTRPDRGLKRTSAEPQQGWEGDADRGLTPVADDEALTTARQRMAYVKACLPDYALLDLKTRAARERVSVNHILMKALTLAGIPIKPEDMIEDGRRLRGKRAIVDGAAT